MKAVLIIDIDDNINTEDLKPLQILFNHQGKLFRKNIRNCKFKPMPKMKDEVEEMNKEKDPRLMFALLDRAIGYNACIYQLLGEEE